LTSPRIPRPITVAAKTAWPTLTMRIALSSAVLSDPGLPARPILLVATRANLNVVQARRAQGVRRLDALQGRFAVPVSRAHAALTFLQIVSRCGAEAATESCASLISQAPSLARRTRAAS